MSSLRKFSAASGLKVYPLKSFIYLTRVDNSTKDSILNLLGNFPFMYLGVPLYSERITTIWCKSLVDKVTTRLQSWSAKLLSYVGKVHLVKYVIR